MELKKILKDFPILQHPIHNHRLVYLDNASTTQKPQIVIDTLCQYYEHMNASVHRGIHYLSEKATESFEESRRHVQKFINAAHAYECIFLKNATEGINLVAHSFAEAYVQAGDEIVISALEHHSNIIPWQLVCQRKKAVLKVIPITETGELVPEWSQYLTSQTKLLAITHVSNAIGTYTALEPIIQTAHRKGIAVLVDGTQSAPHIPIDVQALDCDFFVFSGHKIYGPTGVGVLYGKSRYLEAMPPYQGGNMILAVDFEKSTYNHLPYKFEAGTPPIAEVLALSQALYYLENIGWDAIIEHEKNLLDYAIQKLTEIPRLQFIGTAPKKIGVLSFVIPGIHPHDIGSIVDQAGVAIRTGHHCAMPLMKFFQVPATARASIGIYNTKEDIDKLKEALQRVLRVFKIKF